MARLFALSPSVNINVHSSLLFPPAWFASSNLAIPFSLSAFLPLFLFKSMLALKLTVCAEQRRREGVSVARIRVAIKARSQHFARSP